MPGDKTVTVEGKHYAAGMRSEPGLDDKATWAKIRPWFIARGAQLPFVLTVLGVLGGALAFGLLGIFLGPVLLGIGFTLVNEWARSSDPAGATPDH